MRGKRRRAESIADKWDNRLPDLAERRRTNAAKAVVLLAELVRQWPGPSTAPTYRAAQQHLAGDPLSARSGNRWGEVRSALGGLLAAWPVGDRGDWWQEHRDWLAWACRSCGVTDGRHTRDGCCRECHQRFVGSHDTTRGERGVNPVPFIPRAGARRAPLEASGAIPGADTGDPLEVEGSPVSLPIPAA